MVGLVINKPFKKRKINYNITKNYKKIKLIYPKFKFPIKRFWIFLIIIVFVYGLFFVIKSTVFKSENYIKKVFYSQISVEQYDNPYLYKQISQIIKDENYFIVSKLKRKKIQKMIQKEFPMVKSIKFAQPQSFTISVLLNFYEPDIVLKLGERKFAIIGDYDFEIFSGNIIGDSIFFIDLPQYLSGIPSLHGLFFEISPEKLIHDMDIISQGFSGYDRIVYLPGSSMTVIFIGNKKIYLNNKNSLIEQINNYNLLVNNYSNIDSVSVVDLGSLDLDKIIIK